MSKAQWIWAFIFIILAFGSMSALDIWFVEPDLAWYQRWYLATLLAPFLAICTIVLPRRIRLDIQIHREKNHMCQHCGYSMDGLNSGQCPECGKSFLKEALLSN